MTFRINTLVPELWCSDFQKSMEFYVKTIGFKVAQQRNNDPHAYLSLDGGQIMLAHWKPDGSWEPWNPKPIEQPFGRGVNFQFMVDDVQGIYDRINSSGFRPFMDIDDTDYWKSDCMETRRQFMVLDPDGYLLRFAQALRTRTVEEADLQRMDEQYGTTSL
ncbi:VOC family protein [uncultured Sneathiella sp.]|jgi:catechol 2,3-dioxygenase-like lactoylglutathione lyase family enzyme|uniref:bleomycin resistance protein n=1 Tax=uncultured Sneathiella sp. TaxID=879315 RepID=UPI0030D97DE7|tara:strand:- start:533 stop:1015 length:483 start_codon:yes stop_codon:yes gene_type:complete